MKFLKNIFVFVLLMLMCLPVVSCKDEKKEQAKLIVSEQEFIVRRDNKNAFVIDARGKVKNVGEVDVKNVSITGYCVSCGELINPGNWFVSDYEKTPEQKDVINYLAAGTEEAFSFKGVAFIYNMVPEAPESVPETMEVIIESFETIDIKAAGINIFRLSGL